MRLFAVLVLGVTMVLALGACQKGGEPQQPPADLVTPDALPAEADAAAPSEQAPSADQAGQPADAEDTVGQPDEAMSGPAAPETASTPGEEAADEEPKVVEAMGRAFLNALFEPASGEPASSDEAQPADADSSSDDASPATPPADSTPPPH